MKRIGLFAIAASLALALSAQAALARCAQRDLAGDWQFYNSFAEPGVGAGWSRCLVSLDRDGMVLGSSDCVDFDGATPNIVDGLLSVTSDCVVSGEVTVNDGFETSTASLEHATMDSRGTVIHGVGRDVGSLAGFSFSMIKK